MPQFGARLQFFEHADTIRCPRCGNAGTVTWENSPKGEQALSAIESGFYERLRRKAPYHIELVCKECGTPQKLATQS
jgi:hypothetical protein